jgi:hypothetical protein
VPRAAYAVRTLVPRSLVAVASLAGACGFLAATAEPVEAACAAASSNAIGGTFSGIDDRYVSGQIGVELFDADGTKIGMDGCPMGVGYAKTDLVNEKSSCCFLLPGAGSTSSTYEGHQLEKSWLIPNLPTNARTVWLEAYPKSTDAPDGPHRTDRRRYGSVLRRPLAVGRTDVHVRLPLHCDAGGDTGAIRLTVYDDGVPVPTNVSVFSSEPDRDSPPLGWGQGAPDPTGGTTVGTLAPGTYWVLYNGAGPVRTTAEVTACNTTHLRFSVRGPLPAGDDTPGVVRAGDWFLRNESSDGPPHATIEDFTPAGARSIAGDWDGDGKDTVGYVSGNTFHLRNSNSAGDPHVVFSYGRPGDRPVVGDWDGDGVDTVGVRRGNVFYLRNTNTTGVADITLGYGVHTDTPVVGDWDGNGTDTFGVRRNNAFYLRNTNTTGIADITLGYGVHTDTPVVGDWDGNGTDTFGVRRGSEYLLRNTNTSGPATVTFTYGLTDDIPIVGDWDGA